MSKPSKEPESPREVNHRAPTPDDFFAEVYDELRRIAHLQRVRVRGNETLNTTAVVHEAYVKLKHRPDITFENETHFRCVASKAMRQLLVDYSRRRKAGKRGGEWQRVDLEQSLPAESVTFDDQTADRLIALDLALGELAEIDERQAEVVECRFFGGLSIAETAQSLGVGTATVKRDWAKAQLWLYARLKDKASDSLLNSN